MLGALLTPYIDGVLVVAFSYAIITLGLQLTLASLSSRWPTPRWRGSAATPPG